VTRSQTPGYLSGFGSGRCFRQVRTGDAIVPGPVMLIGSYRSFPCVAPCELARPDRIVRPDLAHRAFLPTPVSAITAVGT